GAEFTDSLVRNLLRLIQSIRVPATPSRIRDPVVKPTSEKEMQKELFSGQCRPDNLAAAATAATSIALGTMLDEDEVKVTTDILRELEALMPSATEGQGWDRDLDLDWDPGWDPDREQHRDKDRDRECRHSQHSCSWRSPSRTPERKKDRSGHRPGGRSESPPTDRKEQRRQPQQRQRRRWHNLVGEAGEETCTGEPDRPSQLLLVGAPEGEDDCLESKRPITAISDLEKREIKQMTVANVLSKEEFPDFDQETGILLQLDGEEDEDLEIELVDEEPPFLWDLMKGSSGDTSPVVKMVKKPDGSLSRAAMMQSALAQVRRELKQALQWEANMDSMRTGLHKHWVDPLPEAQGTQIAAKMRGIGVTPSHIPEWKRRAFGGHQ
ncbi:ATP-dependent RNA helicase DHX8-like, partial [Fukomys damarensis]|uniref:ATP-dependent RNA helicase DHX8-like n=1 Tax=Fukomys damarensis TaxID=885580 RepID=UPI001455CD4F